MSTPEPRRIAAIERVSALQGHARHARPNWPDHGRGSIMKLSVTTWSFPGLHPPECQGIARALGIGPRPRPLLPRLARPGARRLGPARRRRRAPRPRHRAANLYWLFGASPEETRSPIRPRSPATSRSCAPSPASPRPCPSPPSSSSPASPAPAPRAPSSSPSPPRAPAPCSRLRRPRRDPDGGAARRRPPRLPRDDPALPRRRPGLRLTLDYAHFACMGLPAGGHRPPRPPRAHVHLRRPAPARSRRNGARARSTLGRIIGTLREAGYDGYLAVEYVHQSYMNTLSTTC
jgi:hypothetical protein